MKKWKVMQDAVKYTAVVIMEEDAVIDKDGKCDLVCLISPVDKFNDKDRENAQLIASAPDMLEALKEITEGKGRYDLDRLTHAKNTIEDLISIAKDAIDKATNPKNL